jgi:hypothetical protein
MKFKFKRQKITIILAIAIVFFYVVQVRAYSSEGGSHRTWFAQSSLETNNAQVEKPIVFAAPPPPPDIGAPGQRSQAGSRGCSQSQKSPASSSSDGEKRLTALVPVYNTSDSQLVWGLTTSARPTFWFYIPHALTPQNEIEFVLKDNQDNYAYKTKFSGKKTLPGIVNLSLPPTVSLSSSRDYTWYFLIYCGSRTPDSYVNGLIRRVDRPNLEKQLRAATLREQVALYAEQGIWYDALSELAKLHRNNAQNDKVERDWTSLLGSIGLESLTSEPFVSF